ncbi:MAG: ATP-binding cassette domain-containing protein, partial [Terrimicrobiaceae bacterium]
MDDGAIIEVRGLTAAYGDDVILKDVSFEVSRGEVFVVLGGSGCGKSTLLKHLIGLYRLASGEVLIDGENLATATGADRQRILRRFGVAYQSGALFGSMTLSENVTLPIEEFTRLPLAAREVIS